MTSRIVFKALLNIYDRLPEKIVKGEKLAFLNVSLIFEKPQRIEATFVYSNLVWGKFATPRLFPHRHTMSFPSPVLQG